MWIERMWKARLYVALIAPSVFAVHVEMKQNTLLPSVDYIELFGDGGAYERKAA
jgi:hypothetical protein